MKNMVKEEFDIKYKEIWERIENYELKYEHIEMTINNKKYD